MFLKLSPAIALTASLLAAQTNRSDLLQVKAVRHYELAEATRVVIEVTGDFKYRSERLHNPERIFFDVLQSRPQIEFKRNLNRELEDKLLKRIRVAETLPGVTRVVLDLQTNAEITASQLSNPNRLVVELRTAPAGSATPPAEAPAAPPPPQPPPTRPAPDVSPAPILTTAAAAPAPLTPAVAKPVPVTVKPGPAKLEAPVEVVKSEPKSPPANSTEPAKAARPTTSTGKSSLIRALGLKVTRVVLDPGHGGHDQGTMGPKGLLEKELVLDVAQRLGKLIEERLGAEVIYTRTDDAFVPLEDRTALANEKKADLFLSIHANSSPLTRIAGVETFYLNFTDSKEALDVASRENASSQKSIFELRDIIQKITLHDKASESQEFAGRIQASLFQLSARSGIQGAARNRGVKKAPFVVLIGATMPSVLAEIGFVSNTREETNLKKPEYRQKIADALYRGLARYAESLSHFQMAAANEGE